MGIWVGNDDNRPMQGVSGGGLPARIWRSFMLQALNLQPPPAVAKKAAGRGASRRARTMLGGHRLRAWSAGSAADGIEHGERRRQAAGGPTPTPSRRSRACAWSSARSRSPPLCSRSPSSGWSSPRPCRARSGPIDAPSITILSAEGEPIARRGAIIGAPVDVTRLPPYVGQAFIAIEDRRFFRHVGIDPWGMGRAMWRDLRAGPDARGRQHDQPAARQDQLPLARRARRPARSRRR